MLVRFILHLEALGRESLGQLACDDIGGSHPFELGDARLSVNPDSLF
jgi:hypothetical protein